jgi:hypothetical protein
MSMTIFQPDYGNIEIDTREKDVINLWQEGKQEINVLMVERDMLDVFIEQLTKLKNSK